MITKSIYNVNDIQYIFIVMVILLVVDGVWLYIMKDTFGKLIKDIQSAPLKLRIAPAIIAYIAMTLGLYHFVIKEKKSVIHAVFLGIFMNTVYECTNYATFNKWSVDVVVKDILWGGAMFGITIVIFYSIYNAMNNDKIPIL